MSPIDVNSLQKFIKLASSKTFAGDAPANPNPQIQGFIELSFDQGDYSYVDSYTGFFRSRGMEIVYYKGKPIWTASYGGGMIDSKESLANQTFNFLKKAFLQRSEDSFRGPKTFTDGDWNYNYTQAGDTKEFSGSEEIQYKGHPVFFHKVIGGLIKDQS